MRAAQPGEPDRLAGAVRSALVATLAVAPFASGAVHPPAYVPLLAVCALAGAWALLRSRRSRPRSPTRPDEPGGRLLLGLHALVLLQLAPLPPALLALVSPGSLAARAGGAAGAWHPISVSPIDTARGLVFLAAFSLLLVVAARELAEPPWPRRLAAAVATAGVGLTAVGLVQAASDAPGTIYGLWRPAHDWAVYGPYVNRNHFAGYVEMAFPLAVGLAAEAALGGAPRRRRRWLVALADASGQRAVRWAVAAVVTFVGLLACRSRGGLLALAAAAVALGLGLSRRRVLVLLGGSLLVLGLSLVDHTPLVRAFESRGLVASRLDAWRDMLPHVTRFPLFGSGLNAFGPAYRPFQTISRYDYWGQAHNEYLQVLFDTGLLGVVLAAALAWRLLRAALAVASRQPLAAGIVAALAASAAHALVDFNWQIPANAATAIALAGVTLGAAARRSPEGRGPSR